MPSLISGFAKRLRPLSVLTAFPLAFGSSHLLASTPFMYQADYDRGFDAGYADGYHYGYGNGVGRGEYEGQDAGASDGFDAGWEEAYQPAYDAAYDTQHEVGHSTGYEVGIVDGFADGLVWQPTLISVTNGTITLSDWTGLQVSVPNPYYGGSSGSITITSDTNFSIPWFPPVETDWAAHYYNKGFDEGFDEGELIGDAEGYEAAYAPAYEAAYAIAFDEGFLEGELTGTTEGGEAGYADGYDIGYDAGEGEGFQLGVQHRLFQALAGMPHSSASPVAIPEPASCLLVVLGALCSGLRRRD